MVKKILIIAAVILLIVLFGTWPLSLLGYAFEYVGIGLKWLAKILDLFKWNGLLI